MRHFASLIKIYPTLVSMPESKRLSSVNPTQVPGLNPCPDHPSICRFSYLRKSSEHCRPCIRSPRQCRSCPAWSAARLCILPTLGLFAQSAPPGELPFQEQSPDSSSYAPLNEHCFHKITALTVGHEA